MIYFWIEPDRITAKRFRKGRDLYSAEIPAILAVAKNKRGQWKAQAVGEDAELLLKQKPKDMVFCRPFSSREVLLEDADFAAEFLQHVIMKHILGPFAVLRPVVMLHPRVEPERKLSILELRNLEMIAMRGGARKLFICEQPHMLTADDIRCFDRPPAHWEDNPVPLSRIKP